MEIGIIIPIALCKIKGFSVNIRFNFYNIITCILQSRGIMNVALYILEKLYLKLYIRHWIHFFGISSYAGEYSHDISISSKF